jgi:hypothetical protein
MDHVVKILFVVLMNAEGKRAQTGIDVAHVVEEHTIDVCSN